MAGKLLHSLPDIYIYKGIKRDSDMCMKTLYFLSPSPFQFPFFLGKLRCCSKKRSFLALGQLGQGRGVICSEKYIERGRPYVGGEEYIISPPFLFFFRTKNFLFYDPFLPFFFRQLSTHTRVSPSAHAEKKI